TLTFFGVLLPVLGYAVSRRSPRSLESPQEQEPILYRTPGGSFLLIVAAITRQRVMEPKRRGLKLIMMALLMFTLLATLFYCSTLTSNLTVPTYQQPIKTIQQLLETDMLVGSLTDSWRQQFKLSDNPDIQKLVPRYVSLDDYPSHLSEVVEGKMTIFAVSKTLRALMDSLPENQVRLMEECPYTNSVGALLKLNSPLKDDIDRVIMQMQSSGILDRFLVDTQRYLRRRDARQRSAKISSSEDTSNQVTLNLGHLQGAFIVFLGGCLVSTVCFLCELAMHHCKMSIQEHTGAQE
ncbi:Ionotropic receptor 135, partial [Hyalella azteca]